jgi:hypothetical protein
VLEPMRPGMVPVLPGSTPLSPVVPVPDVPLEDPEELPDPDVPVEPEDPVLEVPVDPVLPVPDEPPLEGLLDPDEPDEVRPEVPDDPLPDDPVPDDVVPEVPDDPVPDDPPAPEEPAPGDVVVPAPCGADEPVEPVVPDPADGEVVCPLLDALDPLLVGCEEVEVLDDVCDEVTWVAGSVEVPWLDVVEDDRVPARSPPAAPVVGDRDDDASPAFDDGSTRVDGVGAVVAGGPTGVVTGLVPLPASMRGPGPARVTVGRCTGTPVKAPPRTMPTPRLTPPPTAITVTFSQLGPVTTRCPARWAQSTAASSHAGADHTGRRAAGLVWPTVAASRPATSSR